MAAEEPRSEETTAETPKKKFNFKTIAIIGGFAVLQAVVVVVILYVVRGAHSTPEAAAATTAAPAEEEVVTVPVLVSDPDAKIQAVNTRSGQLTYWTLKVSLRVPAAQQDYITERLKKNEDLVKQEITTVVAGSDPIILEQEADHATLKRKIRYALNGILGKGTINEIVIPECLPSRLD